MTALTEDPAPPEGGQTQNDLAMGAVHGFLRAALYVSLAPLFFAVLGILLGKLNLLDPVIAHDAVARGLAARTALAGIITGIVALGVAGYGGFRALWPKAVLPLALSIASYFAAIYIL